MMNKSELEKCRSADIMACSPDSLADLKEIKIDTTAPVYQRMNSFFHQVRNPYLFKVGDIVVKVKYGGDRDFSDALASLLNTRQLLPTGKPI